MQDRYAGDLGDFLKLGLLRWLVTPSVDMPPHRLGVVWYLAPDEWHNADGKHVDYLTSQSRAGSELRPLDADLYSRLAAMVAGGNRSVAQLELFGVLPSGSRTFAQPLQFDDLAPSALTERASRRRTWLDAARAATDNCSVVFVDPDNGLRRSDHRVRSHQSKAHKHVYLDELRPFVERGQSVVAYHHADRSAKVPIQAQRRMADIAEELGVEPLAAVRASRGTTRLFLIIPAPAHIEYLARRLTELEESRWSDELTVYWQGAGDLSDVI
jgi:hypothetical protein